MLRQTKPGSHIEARETHNSGLPRTKTQPCIDVSNPTTHVSTSLDLVQVTIDQLSAGRLPPIWRGLDAASADAFPAFEWFFQGCGMRRRRGRTRWRRSDWRWRRDQQRAWRISSAAAEGRFRESTCVLLYLSFGLPNRCDEKHQSDGTWSLHMWRHHQAIPVVPSVHHGRRGVCPGTLEAVFQ